MDWVSRNLFWTSYDANKKQINVARLDGSFKNAVIQGLDKPHCLVVHPLRGYVWLDAVPAGCGGDISAGLPCSVSPPQRRKLYWTDGDNISVANMDGSNRTLLFTNQKGPVGTDPPVSPGVTLPCGALQSSSPGSGSPGAPQAWRLVCAGSPILSITPSALPVLSHLPAGDGPCVLPSH